MTVSNLQSIASLLSRACYVRHWLHFNYPQREPWLMALSVKDATDFDALAKELAKSGFTLIDHDGLKIFTVPRTTESGQPFRSNL